MAGMEKKRTTRTERGVVVPADVALRTGYHYRLVHPVDEAVDVYALEGITVLPRRECESWQRRSHGSREARRSWAFCKRYCTVPFRGGLEEQR